MCELVIFQLHLILHTCVRKFDVTDTVQTVLETKRSPKQICNSSQSVTPLSLVLLAHRLKFSDTEATIPETHFSVFIFLCCWNIWKHRNRVVVFDVAEPSLQTLLCSCRDEARVWAWRMPRTDIANLA